MVDKKDYGFFTSGHRIAIKITTIDSAMDAGPQKFIFFLDFHQLRKI